MITESVTVTRVVFKLVGCQTKLVDSMTISKILIGRMALIFSFHFCFIISVSANIW